MERFVREMDLHRSSFENVYEETMNFLQDPDFSESDILGNLEILGQKMEILSDLNRRFLNQMLESDTPHEDIEAELGIADKLSAKYLRLKYKVENLMNKNVTNMNSVSVASTASSSKRKVKLPNLELKKFSGDVKDWLSF